MLLILFCLLHFFIAIPTNGLNITQILGQYPSFSTFNNHLSQTKVADQINGRNTITILAVDNAGMSPLSEKSQDVIKMIMSIHIVLDYYDVQKLQRMKNKTVMLTTLYQTSGQARGQTGFLNATLLDTGSVAIGSAEGGSKLNSNLVKSVFSSPYNVSVLQVSTVIMPPGFVGPVGPGPTPMNPTGPPTNAPTPSGAMPMPPGGGKPPPMGGKAPAPGPSHNGGAMPPNSGKAPAPMVASPPAPPGAGGGAAGSNNSAGAPAPIMASPPAPPGEGAGTGTAPAGTTTSPAANDPAADAPQGGDTGTDNNSSATMDAVCNHVLVIFLSLLSILWFGLTT